MKTALALMLVCFSVVCAGGLISDAILKAKPDSCVVEMTDARMRAWGME